MGRLAKAASGCSWSQLKLVIAITAGNYGTEDQWMPPTRVLREVVLASVPITGRLTVLPAQARRRRCRSS